MTTAFGTIECAIIRAGVHATFAHLTEFRIAHRTADTTTIRAAAFRPHFFAPLIPCVGRGRHHTDDHKERQQEAEEALCFVFHLFIFPFCQERIIPLIFTECRQVFCLASYQTYHTIDYKELQCSYEFFVNNFSGGTCLPSLNPKPKCDIIVPEKWVFLSF